MERDMSTAALVLSTLALFCCGLPFSIAAIVLVIVAVRREGEFTAKTIIALVFSILGILSTVLGWIYSAVLYEMFLGELEKALSESGTLRLAGPSCAAT